MSGGPPNVTNPRAALTTPLGQSPGAESKLGKPSALYECARPRERGLYSSSAALAAMSDHIRTAPVSVAPSPALRWKGGVGRFRVAAFGRSQGKKVRPRPSVEALSPHPIRLPPASNRRC